MPVGGGFKVIRCQDDRDPSGASWLYLKGEQIKEFCFFRKAEVSRTTCM